ncbi:hypothetical protein BDZ91DRAFT_848790 [Kalaharituber pfeilii]|nr:hypothetical protein BDZ91DRAFT_848790 [Kalaharituber pfeilii]
MPPVRTHKRSNSFSGNGNSVNGATTNATILLRQAKSKTAYSFHDLDAQARIEQEEEDAAIDRATRAFELEAAKTRLHDERDLRDFARAVFRREYRAYKLDKWRKGTGMFNKRPSEWDRKRQMPWVTERSRSWSPDAVGMEETAGEYPSQSQYSGYTDNDEAMQTDEDQHPKGSPSQRRSTNSKSSCSASYRSPSTTPRKRSSMQSRSTSAVTGDTISIPHAIQRKLLQSMNKLCLTSAFNFTKRYKLPLTLNIFSPSPHTTRLTIHSLTDAIIAAYNNGSIPPESLWEDIAFGFVGVFEAAGVLDDAILYFKMRLTDRRMRAVLLAGVDLLQALRDEDGVAKGEEVMREAETLIDGAKKAWKGGEEDGDWDEDMGVTTEEDEEETLEESEDEESGANGERSKIIAQESNGDVRMGEEDGDSRHER